MSLPGDALLLRPLWLLALPVLGLLGWRALREHGGPGGWKGLIDDALLPVLAAIGHVAWPQTRAGTLLPLGAAGVLCFALSGPALRRDDAPSFQNLDGVLLVMDMSPSLTRGGSLDDAQAAAAYILQNLGGRPAGLILFASESYLVSTLTVDAGTITTPIAVLDERTMPDTGSRPDRALEMAEGVLSDAAIIGGDVILFSDGGGITPAAHAAAKVIAGGGGRVSTVHVAPERADPQAPKSDPVALAALASSGGGIAIDSRQIFRMADLVRNSRNRRFARSALASLLFLDAGRFFAGLALIPAFLLFRRSQ